MLNPPSVFYQTLQELPPFFKSGQQRYILHTFMQNQIQKNFPLLVFFNAPPANRHVNRQSSINPNSQHNS